MDEECEEDGEAKARVGVIGSVGDEALGDLVEGNGNTGLEADGEERVGWNVVVVYMRCSRGVRVERILTWSFMD